jgi:small subunit ribosomal protein S2
MVDTNSDPREVEFVIPSNDDASKSIDKILSLVTAAIVEGLSDRGSDKKLMQLKKQLRRQKQ